MSDSSATVHEPRAQLSGTTLDLHRALVSLQEELEAADWYRQRADACGNAELTEILLHNMREEMEHAAMILEWLRRNQPDFAAQLATYLNTEGPITEVEEAATGADTGADEEDDHGAPAPAAEPAATSFSVGTLKE